MCTLFALQAGHLQLCKYLLENLKFNVNAQDKNGGRCNVWAV